MVGYRLAFHYSSTSSQKPPADQNNGGYNQVPRNRSPFFLASHAEKWEDTRDDTRDDTCKDTNYHEDTMSISKSLRLNDWLRKSYIPQPLIIVQTHGHRRGSGTTCLPDLRRPCSRQLRKLKCRRPTFTGERFQMLICDSLITSEVCGNGQMSIRKCSKFIGRRGSARDPPHENSKEGPGREVTREVELYNIRQGSGTRTSLNQTKK